MARRRPTLRAAALAGLTAALLAPAPPAGGQEDRFSDETSVVLVEVPVQVTDRGEPVRGLTAADFAVFDQGRRREIVDFQVIDLTREETREEAAPSAAPSMPLAARRTFLLLFDLSFSQPASVERARLAAEELVSGALHPSDLIGVAIYTAAEGARLALGFTSDRKQLAETLAGLSPGQPLRHFQDPLALVVGDMFDPGHPYRGGGGGGDNKSTRFEIMQQTARDLSGFASLAERQRREADVLNLTSSLGELGALLRGMEGRKHVVQLSEGFDSSVVVGSQDTARIEEMAEDSMRGEFWLVDSEERFGSAGARLALDRAMEEFRRSDAMIHTVDIGGLRTRDELGRGSRGHDGLFLIADQTGGEFYRETNDLDAAMGEVLERTSVTYLLAFQPEDLPADGSFRRLKVRLEGGPKGARLAHRPGYYAPRPFAEISPEERRMSAAGLLVGGRDGGALDVAVLAAPMPLEPTGSWVPVLTEVGGPALLADARGETIPLELYAYAIASDGTVHDYFSRLVSFDLAAVRPSLAHGGFKFWGRFDLEPGDYALRVLVRNALTGSIGLKSFALHVPRFTEGEPALSPPLVPEPPGRWILARERGAAPDPPYPFVLAGEPFVPAARVEIGRGEPLTLSLIGFNLEHGASLGARLFAADGSMALEGPLALERRETMASGEMRLTARLEGADLAPGDYELQVALSGADAGAGAASGRLPLRVVAQ